MWIHCFKTSITNTHLYLVGYIGNSARTREGLPTNDFELSSLQLMLYRHPPPSQPSLLVSGPCCPAEPGPSVARQRQSHRDTIFEGDPLQGVAVCHPMLHELLPQGGRHAGSAAVRADLRPGQALGQLALRLGTGSGPREDGLAESSSSSIPHRQDGRELRHLLSCG